MDDRQLLLLIIVITVIVVVFIYILFHMKTTAKRTGCTSDSQCSGSLPVCHDGRCVECNFDSECCGADICMNHECRHVETTPPTPPACGPVLLDGDSDFQRLTNNDPQTWFELDLNQFVDDDCGGIDWSTFEIVEILEDGTVPGGAVGFSWTPMGSHPTPAPWANTNANWQVTPAGLFQVNAYLRSAGSPDPYRHVTAGICNTFIGGPVFACDPACAACNYGDGDFTLSWRVSSLDGGVSNVATFDFQVATTV